MIRGLEWSMERKAGIRLSSALKARVRIVTFIPKKPQVKWVRGTAVMLLLSENLLHFKQF